MSVTEQRESFAALVREHEPIRSPKLKILMELRDSIFEARKKGASHEIIRLFLHQTGIDVSTDTVARFCHKILGERKGRKPRQKPVQQPQESAATMINQKRANARGSLHYQPSTGPRIVNPKDL
jgi:hypothetical protein